MRVVRIYHPEQLTNREEVSLSEEATHHVGRVLRMSKGDKLDLFDGSNNVFHAIIIKSDKKQVIVYIESAELENKESPLFIHLGQVISRGEKMEFTIQKSTELGVNVITPLISSRCGVRLDDDRLEKKRQQWQKIAIAACEVCGRNRIPEIRPVEDVSQWCAEQADDLKLTLHPRAKFGINSLSGEQKRIRLLIGPEGGLSDEEISMTTHLGFNEILLGPRVLRTETASLAVITALQLHLGDLG